uniref:Uncharacterized protein n=1 Tax=Cannabis sativa TaxID=3483 RepID=A0A803QCA4_CANSA
MFVDDDGSWTMVTCRWGRRPETEMQTKRLRSIGHWSPFGFLRALGWPSLPGSVVVQGKREIFWGRRGLLMARASCGFPSLHQKNIGETKR